jgi:hypothetical protein
MCALSYDALRSDAKEIGWSSGEKKLALTAPVTGKQKTAAVVYLRSRQQIKEKPGPKINLAGAFLGANA